MIYFYNPISDDNYFYCKKVSIKQYSKENKLRSKFNLKVVIWLIIQVRLVKIMDTKKTVLSSTRVLITLWIEA